MLPPDADCVAWLDRTALAQYHLLHHPAARQVARRGTEAAATGTSAAGRRSHRCRLEGRFELLDLWLELGRFLIVLGLDRLRELCLKAQVRSLQFHQVDRLHLRHARRVLLAMSGGGGGGSSGGVWVRSRKGAHQRNELEQVRRLVVRGEVEQPCLAGVVVQAHAQLTLHADWSLHSRDREGSLALRLVQNELEGLGCRPADERQTRGA